MNIDPQTLSLAIQIATAMQSQSTTEAQASAHPLIGRKVLIRDHRAGVYCGTLTEIDVHAGTATLSDARQIWYWRGAAACTGIAARGIVEGSKVCPSVESVTCLDVVQAMPMTDEAWECVRDYAEWTP